MFRFLRCCSACSFMLLGSGLTVLGDTAMQLPSPEVTVSPTPVAPTVDGMIDPEEWRYATRVTGFMTLGTPELANLDTVVYITFDDDHLYVAYENTIAGGRPNAIAIERDGSVWGGDSIELSIAPPWMEPHQYYHLIGNYHGSIHDLVQLDGTESGAADQSWDGNWQFANYLWEGMWSAELAIPLKDLRVEDPRGEWRMNFARTEGTHTSWSPTGRGYHNPQAYGTVTLSDTPLVVGLDQVQGAASGELEVLGSIFNPSDEEQQVTVELTLKPLELLLGSDDAVLTQAVQRLEQQLTVPPDSSEPFDFLHSFSDRALDLLNIEVRSDDDVLLRSDLPFVLDERRVVKLIPVPAEDQMLVQLDLRRLAGDEPINVVGHFIDPRGEEVARFTVSNVEAGQVVVEPVALEKMPPDEYKVMVDVREADAEQSLMQENATFMRRETPRWYTEGRQLGLEPKVLAPWTPMEQAEDNVSMWGRRYALGDSVLFEQIDSRDEPLLAAPMTLEAEVDGESVEFEFIDRTFTSVKPHEVNWTTRGRLGSVEVSVTCHAEFDGMVRVNLMLNAAAQAEVSRLTLRMPMTEAASEYCHYSSSYYDNIFAGYVPEDGLQLAFLPMLWIGNLERGLTWFAEAPRNYNVRGDTLRVAPGSARDVTVTFIDTPTDVVGELPLEFGLMATPVKKMPDDWRGLNLAGRFDQVRGWDQTPIDWNMLYREGTDAGRYWTNEQGERIRAGHSTPLKLNNAVLKEHIDQASRRGMKSMIYQYLSGASAGRTTDFDRYRAVWERVPVKQLDYGELGLIHGVCLGSSFQDFALFGQKHLVEQTSVDGVYWDGGGGPSLCRNPLHGHGWTDPHSGRLEAAYPLFEARRFNKRLATLYEELKGPGDYVIWNHNSQSMPLPFLSFSTGYLTGESPFQRVRSSGPTLPELASLDYLRVQATGEHWGIVPTWLIYARRGDPAVLRATLAVLLPHGTPLYPLGGVAGSDPDAELIGEVWIAQHAFDIGSATFVGYWEIDGQLTLDPVEPEAVICSLYSHQDKHMLVLANLNEQPREITISLNPSELGELTGRLIRDAISGESFHVDGNQIRARLGSRDFRLIVIENE